MDGTCTAPGEIAGGRVLHCFPFCFHTLRKPARVIARVQLQLLPRSITSERALSGGGHASFHPSLQSWWDTVRPDTAIWSASGTKSAVAVTSALSSTRIASDHFD